MILLSPESLVPPRHALPRRRFPRGLAPAVRAPGILSSFDASISGTSPACTSYFTRRLVLAAWDVTVAVPTIGVTVTV